MQSGARPPLLITLATTNQGKQLELTRWVQDAGLPIELRLNPDAPDIEETGRTFLENARLKASQSPPAPGTELVLAEDSGLVVDALEGQYGISPFPGIYSNRWLTPEIRDELLGRSHPNRMPLDRTNDSGITNTDLCLSILELMQDQPNRAARYCCGMTLWHVRDGLLFETLGSTELRIIDGKPRGTQGFGYDPITAPLYEPRTMAELSPEEKNRISHRGLAFRQVLDYLRTTGRL